MEEMFEIEKNREGRYLFRLIRPEEASRTVYLEEKCFPPHEVCDASMMLPRVAAAPEQFLVVEDRESGELVGMFNGLATRETAFRDAFFSDADLHDPEGDTVMILGLEVLPEYQGQGLGRELVRRYQEQERARGRKRLILTCSDALVGMYESFGFADHGTSASAFGNESWHEMVCEL